MISSREIDLFAIIEWVNEKPMHCLDCIKYLEKTLEKKAEQDVSNLKSRIKPQSMSVFLYDNLI